MGASAGGLKALEEFFTHLPVKTDVPSAFVLVQHMHPEHKSHLCDLMKKYTHLHVCEARDGMEVEPHVIYINPPNRDMTMSQGRLLLREIRKTQGLHLPIDGFFRSLADDQKDRSICIVLSGTGTDGTLGLKSIKGEGGMAMVQDPDSAEHKGMPCSAIATGMVDYILPPKEIPGILMKYIGHAFGTRRRFLAPSVPEDNASMQKILALLHTQTGHDFSGYKLNTITRRLERRLNLNLIKNSSNYFRYLQKNPLEVKALFQDLLVGVTCFFRDAEAFEKLQETVIPSIFAGKDKSHSIRVWVPGCSTGEEAYSLAIFLHEHMEKTRQPLQVKVFATDIDRRAVEYARNGLYPANIVSDVSPERLKRFFTRTDSNTYHINSIIRKMVIFAEQSITGDPPFSNIDLISCRNVLIYLDRELQSKVLHLFHYALKHNGFLFLGTSETTGEFMDFFNVVDRKWRIYQSKGNAALYQTLKNYSAPYIKRVPLRINTHHQQEKMVSIREIAEKTLLRDYAPASVITSNYGDILYFHGRTGKYLEPVQGDANMNIFQMARKGLKVELATAIRKATVQKESSYFQGLHVSDNGQTSTINLKVTPVNEDSELIMVSFEDVVLPESVSLNEIAATSQYGIDEKMAAIEQELQNKDEYLQTIIEELETSNEELQSTNEEFQSTNEELETSKEELGSLNEELMTVNTELQQKIEELTQANNDLNNLLAGTGVATIFIDHNLCIQRFTPTATQIINLIASDVGRPVNHIASNLNDYVNLVEDVQSVLDTLVPKEVEVQSKNGNWYLMRILPYRTLSNAIEGAVVNFIDITEQKNVQRLSRLAVVVQDSLDAFILQDLKGKILAWNPGAEKLYGWSENEALAMNIRDTIPEELRTDALKTVKELTERKSLEPAKTQRLTKQGKTVKVWMNATLLVKDDEPYAIATTVRESD
ncbi:CheR family methyltransferase [Candidatus Contubernalis alkalaceticus]|uniref:CheR family methyltransferase n=1 Tax=Candidatus Contubernalis alkaliaceticus TaxID=338645 RepID=UPI00387E3CE9